MAEVFEVTWEGGLPGSPREVWDAFTRRAAGWLWEVEYEPRAGGAERGLTGGGGTVTVWKPHRRFVTRAVNEEGDVNQLDYVLEPRGEDTYLRYTHRGAIAGDHDLELDACRRHTAFYYHSLGEYLRHFRGRDAAYVSVQAPGASARDGFATLCRALGVTADVAVGDHVRLDPAGSEGVVDYATSTFLGVRGADALYRFYGRDRWNQPVAVAVHRFGGGADEAARVWDAWLRDVFPTEAVA
jgi:Activator of Hsp90 ATPase homolog 1-like protein